MNDVIQTVGAYAGLIALVGLVVVSMLCFSMSRDLRRLREWAGGAPERDAEVREVSEIVAEERSQELKVLAEREGRRLERSGLAGDSFWDRLGQTGRILAIVAAVVILGAGAAYAGTTLLGGDDGGNAGKDGGGKKSAQSDGGGPKAASIDVAVLNGTGGAEVGLAAEYANQLEKDGFKIGSVTDAQDTFTESVVMYTKGNEDAARMVGKSVDIGSTALITSEVADLVPGATVTAVIGTDHSPLPGG
ncbi:MAG: LytR C-terminal domain-containing protein [Thermoleophilia bacterium]|nr:LytR C-terminal domain-containing protein [Thermoleophilia bacterium]